MPETRWPESVPILCSPDGLVTLRAHRPADLAGVVETCTDPEFIQWTTIPLAYTESDGRLFLGTLVPEQVDAAVAMIWAIEAEIDGVRRFCGSIEIRNPRGPQAELAFGLHPAARGRGVMSRAARLATAWAFTNPAVVEILWQAIAGNWPSRWVAESLGFRLTGHVADGLVQRGVPVDAWTALLRRDGFRAIRQPTADS